MMEIVRHQPLYEQVYEQLKEKILAGELKFGEKINEVQIASSLNISRGPVRESVRILEQEGLLIRDSKSQLSIYKPSVQDLIHIYQCRKALESLAVELAVKNITQDQLNQLKQVMDNSKQLSEIENPNEKTKLSFLELNSKFHQIIIKTAQNPRLMSQIGDLQSLTRLYRKFNIQTQERIRVAHSQHFGIYQAIMNNDKDKARKLMENHIEYDMVHLTSYFKKYFIHE